MPKPWKTERAGSQQTQSPRVALEEGIVDDRRPCKRQSARPADGPLDRDRGPQGFIVRRSAPDSRNPDGRRPNGRETYAVAFRHRGRRFFKIIGHADSMDETAARAIAAQVIGEVKTGVRHRPITPNERRFEVFAATFFRRYAPNWKPVTLAGSRRACEAYLMPFFRDMDVGAISPEDTRRWFAALHDRPGAANRSLALLAVMMREAERYGYRDPATNPCKGMRRYRLTKQERFLSDEEYRRLGAFMREQEARTPLQVAMLRLYLLTGCRKSEIRTLKWAYYRAGRNGKRHLFLPDSKTGPKTVYLSDPARAVLDGVPRTADWVFPSTIKRKRGRPRRDETPFFDIEFWKVFRDRAGLAGMRLHDLRHSYASLAIRNGVPLVTVGRLLGHADPETTLQYTHLNDRALAEAVETVARSLSGPEAGR